MYINQRELSEKHRQTESNAGFAFSCERKRFGNGAFGKRSRPCSRFPQTQMRFVSFLNSSGESVDALT